MFTSNLRNDNLVLILSSDDNVGTPIIEELTLQWGCTRNEVKDNVTGLQGDQVYTENVFI